MVQSQVVLVAGGTGFVGRHLVDLLRNAGAKVRVITRKPGNGPDQLSWDAIKSKGLPIGTTAVVNVAGRNILDPVPWTNRFKDEVYSSRIETNRLLVDAIQKSRVKPKSFVSISGVGYYEPSETVEYDEEWTQPEGNDSNYLMRLARDWEQSSALDENLVPNTRRVIVRSGVVLGHDGGVVQNLRVPFNFGLGGPIGSGQQWFPWIHVDDLAAMFKFAILNEHVTGIVNGVAPEQVRNKQFAELFGELLNRPSFLALPSFMVNLLFSSERGDILLKGQRVKSRASLLGFRCQYPTLKEALQECLGDRPRNPLEH